MALSFRFAGEADIPALLSPFYRKCGFTEVGRAVYRRVPLIYFEYPIHGS